MGRRQKIRYEVPILLHYSNLKPKKYTKLKNVGYAELQGNVYHKNLYTKCFASTSEITI